MKIEKGKHMVIGRIHSLETMGAVDGPGVRMVVFMQGCSLRCIYCHNPDTWAEKAEIELTPQELLNKIIRYKPYFGNKGGVTFSGGEPLLQCEFLSEILSLCKQENIHTCIDTAGVGFGDYAKVLKNTDLVILDIKHHTDDGFKYITGKSLSEIDKFLEALQQTEIPVWIRHVVVPGINDDNDHFEKFEKSVLKIKNIQKIEYLPYHTLGVSKYEKMGIRYPLCGVPPLSPSVLKKRNEALIEYIKNTNK